MARITKPPEERKQEIIETALKLFSQKGYENTTIQDIAEEMNVAQGLCYRYFKSKQEIFAASSDYYAQKAVEHMTQSIHEEDDVIQKFNAVIQSLLTYAIKHSEYEATYKDEPEISAERVCRMAVHISDIVVPIVQQGKETGIFRCEDVENTVRLLSFGIINLVHNDMPKDNTKSHILSFVPTIKTVCKNILQTDHSELGVGWEVL